MTEPRSTPPSTTGLATWIDAQVADITDRLVDVRRDIHAHPELGHTEFRTTDLLIEALTALDLQPERLPVGTGLTCDIWPQAAPAEMSQPRLIGLRADIDALPMTEVSGVPFASTVAGLDHACGHDVHTAVLLGVGEVVARARESGRLTRGVRLIFQPAEESSPGGASDVVAAGGLDGVGEVYALHCDPAIEVGQLGLHTGPITSAADAVSIVLRGPGGHTSRPHLTADLIGALSAAANDLPLLLSRRVDPRGTASLVWGSIHAGEAGNAIPESGTLHGTLRCLEPKTWLAARELLPRLVREVVSPWGDLEVEVELSGDIPPTVNARAGVERMSRAAEAMFGRQAVVETRQSLGGEDFGVMLQRAPGAMARLGVRTPGATTWPDLHRPDFGVDESAIGVGTRFLAATALL